MSGMEAAYEDVLAGNMTFAKAAKQHSVDVTQLRHYFVTKSGAAPSGASANNLAASEFENQIIEPDRRQVMQAARTAVLERGLSARMAAREFKLPVSTLNRHIKNPSMRRPGAKTKFSTEEEAEMEKELLDFAAMGVPLAKGLLGKMVAEKATAKGEQINQSTNQRTACTGEISINQIKQSMTRFRVGK